MPIVQQNGRQGNRLSASATDSVQVEGSWTIERQLSGLTYRSSRNSIWAWCRRDGSVPRPVALWPNVRLIALAPPTARSRVLTAVRRSGTSEPGQIKCGP